MGIPADGMIGNLMDARAVVWLQTDELAELTAEEDWNLTAIVTQAAAVVAAALYVERVGTRHADALIAVLPSAIRSLLGHLEKSGLLEGGIRVEQAANLTRGVYQ